MNVTVFGVGYVGLVQAVVLADVGHNVCCVDVDEKKIESLKRGELPIFEPGLSELVLSNHDRKRIEFTTDAVKGINHAELLFIAVGTPPDDDGSADLQYVLAVAGTIASHMSEAKIIIDKSTVPVGTADKVKAHISAILKKRNLDLLLLCRVQSRIFKRRIGARGLHAPRANHYRYRQRPGRRENA